MDSRYVQLPAGFLRIFSLEKRCAIQLSSCGIGDVAQILALLPTDQEVADSEETLFDLSPLPSVYPTLTATLCAWVHKQRHQHGRVQFKLRLPREPSARNWLQDMGVVNEFTGGTARLASGARPLAELDGAEAPPSWR